jgi:hypothetical protein
MRLPLAALYNEEEEEGWWWFCLIREQPPFKLGSIPFKFVWSLDGVPPYFCVFFWVRLTEENSYFSEDDCGSHKKMQTLF